MNSTDVASSDTATAYRAMFCRRHARYLLSLFTDHEWWSTLGFIGVMRFVPHPPGAWVVSAHTLSAIRAVVTIRGSVGCVLVGSGGYAFVQDCGACLRPYVLLLSAPC